MSTGLKVTKVSGSYPFELSTKELITHKQNISEYTPELSENLYSKALLYKPDLKLISQQPELTNHLRQSCLEFLLKISIKTKVTDGIFYQAVRIFDRYCSRRIVLRNQLQLVLGTCLWLSAKTYGGCNHVINNSNIPAGGRFNGPNPRARIPRLTELVQSCNNNNSNEKTEIVDQSMFVQMERHILNTLNWDVVEPKLSNWTLEFYELNLLQLQQVNDSKCFNEKIEIINLKKLLSDLITFELSMIEFHPEQITQIIFHILEQYYQSVNSTYISKSELLFNSKLSLSQLQNYSTILFSKIVRLFETSQFLYNTYIVGLNCSRFYNYMISSLEIEENDNDYTYSISSKSSIQTARSFFYNTPNSTNTTLTLSKVPIHNYHPHSFPTPPNSRRGSPTGITDIHKHQMIYGNAVGITSPLTPNEVKRKEEEDYKK